MQVSVADRLHDRLVGWRCRKVVAVAYTARVDLFEQIAEVTDEPLGGFVVVVVVDQKG